MLASVHARLVAVVVCVAAAAHYSLGTLLADWRYQAPESELALVPLLAAGLLVAAALRHPFAGAVRLGRVDLFVGSACLVTALAVTAIGPAELSSYFWAMRLDLLVLPLVAAGAVVLLFGLRSLAAFAFPLFFLFLSWPLPFAVLAENTLAATTRLTAAAVGRVVTVLPVGEFVHGADGAQLAVRHGGGRFVVTVASACSGLGSLTGFAVIGIASLYLVRGRVLRRATWLATGLVVVWAFNVLRIVAILAVGRVLGRAAAFDVLHPVAGLLALNLAFALMWVLLPRFGLRFRGLRAVAAADTPLARPAPAVDRPRSGHVARRLVLLAVPVAALALANGELRAVASGFDGAGLPVAAPLVSHPDAGAGWTVRPLDRIDWAKPFYGGGYRWMRYRVRPAAVSAASRRPFTIWLDAIVAHDVGALDAHTIPRCYRFHGYTLVIDRRVQLGHGVVGRLVVYRDRGGVPWHALTWDWPVRLAAGRVGHERLLLRASSPARPVLLSQRRDESSLTSAVLAALDRGSSARDDNEPLARALVAVAAGIVHGHLHRGVGA